MDYDEFFTDGDKPYAENLNDGLALIDAFDISVPLQMPTMFNNGEFNSTLNVTRKCNVSLVTLKSVDSGVTVGTDEISGTGELVFRVYPNFNCFYKWQKIVLEKSGTVNIGFRKIDGTDIPASVGSDGTISDNSALKQLQEIDVVFTLSNASISNILIWFVNNQGVRNRTGARLEASQLVNVDGEVVTGENKAVNGGTVKTALDSLHTTVTGEIEDLSDSVDSDLSNLSDELNSKLTNGLNLKEDKSNKVTTLDNSSSHYPSCIAVKNITDNKSNVGHHHISSDITDLINVIYPVGAIYISVNSTSPSVLFGGTWKQLEDTFLFATSGTADTGYKPTAGESTHKLTVDEIPNHHHLMGSLTRYTASSTAGAAVGYGQGSSLDYRTSSVGGGQAHNNMPPYMKVYMWKRTG